MKKRIVIDSKHYIQDLYNTFEKTEKRNTTNLCYPELTNKIINNDLERQTYLSKLYGY